MTSNNQQKALLLLRQALNNSTAEFRDGQWEAIEAITEYQSRLLVVQRTGWGKSFVYFLATRLLRDKGKGITLLISPLLALMRNQISAAERIGISAQTINSSNKEEKEEIENNLMAGKVDILLITPETLANEKFQENILLPDEEITDYFIHTAFPPEAHNQAVLAALNEAEDGLSVPMLEEKLNLTNGQINKVLKLLSIETPSPVKKIKSKYYATPINYQTGTEKIAKLTQIRYQEQARMRDYMEIQECLMQFLRKELDDPNPHPCGKCAICLGKPIFSENVSSKFVIKAVNFLRSSEQIIEPRKKWPKDGLSTYNFNGKISEDLRAEVGRSLSLWNDAGWGKLVKKGKYTDNHLTILAID
ncbi:MAG: DEAD/DEAH box helicase family protein [Microcoleaceae cyanobacterium MO_207.B10]|nr:DEAD/DEAH box helicase family protein [Microcoleaceae cyanobacterium MO_207.B10]